MRNSLDTLLFSTTLQMKNSFARGMYKFCLLVQPIIFSIISYMMFKNSGYTNFASFVVLGTGILTLWSCICFSSAGDIERERYMGTLQVIYSTPTDFRIILFGKILGNTILGLLPFVISYLSLKILFDIDFIVVSIVPFFWTFMLTIVSFIALSLMFSAVFTLSRSAAVLMNCIEFPVFILCGVLFPLEILPTWTRPLSYILTPTWAVKGLNLCIDGVVNESYFNSIIKNLSLLTVVYFLLGFYLVSIIDKRTRITGTLGVN